jgi:hypothetical protein
MWAFEHSVTTDAKPEQIWAVWMDSENWPLWDEEVEWVRRDGAFQVGTTYKLKPKGGPVATAVIERCEPLQGFDDVTALPLATLRFKHRMHSLSDGQTHITHRVEISGLLTFVFKRVIGAKTAQTLPQAMQKLVERARALSLTV